MKKEIPEIEQPLNANERFLYACAVRLDALCHMMSSLLEHIAEKEGVAITSNKVEEKQVEEAKEEEPKKCVGVTKRGKPCQANAQEGSDYCGIHDKG